MNTQLETAKQAISSIRKRWAFGEATRSYPSKDYVPLDQRKDVDQKLVQVLPTGW